MHTRTQRTLGCCRMCNGVSDVNNLSSVRKMRVNRSMKAGAEPGHSSFPVLTCDGMRSRR